MSHRPSFCFSPSASDALFDASLFAPIGDGAVLRRGDLQRMKAARRKHDIVGKPEPHSHARSARLDAREIVPRPHNKLDDLFLTGQRWECTYIKQSTVII